MILLNIVLVIVAFAILINGANFFVSGAGSIARKMGITPFVVGLTIVAIGTSAPEFFVNVIAAWEGSTELAIGNILGSNLMNIMLGLGVAAIISIIAIKEQTVWREIPFALLSVIVIGLLAFDGLFTPGAPNVITRGDGLILLSFFAIFMIYTFGLTKIKEDSDEDAEIEMFGWSKSILYTVGGIIGLIIGGKIVVTNAIEIANVFGMSENLIGLTIVAMGTSLPEIVTAIVAVRKGQSDIVVGGVIGSTIFNAFFILGSTALVKDVVISDERLSDVSFDVFFLLMISTLFFVFMFLGKRHKLERWQGVFFICLYLAYIGYAIAREFTGISG